MVKTRYTKQDPDHMARVRPLGPNGEEIPVSLVYDQVEVPPNIPNRIVN